MLEGALTVPLGAQAAVGRTDYIVDNVRVGIREKHLDLDYDCHMAEETGTPPGFL